MRIAAILLTAGMLSACAATPDPVAECGAPTGWEAVADVAEGQLLLFGETHGTVESPAMVAAYACAVTKSRGGVTAVGIEWASFRNDDLAAALSADDPRAEMRKSFTKHLSFQSGQGSEAMLDMILFLDALADAGADIRIRGFQTVTEGDFQTFQETGDQSIFERGYARGMLATAEGADRTIILVGNLHARRKPPEGRPWLNYALAASFLPEGTVTLEMQRLAGQAWVQTRTEDGQPRVGPRDYVAYAPQGGQEGAPQIAIDPSVEGFDGYYFVGPITPSPPAIQE